MSRELKSGIPWPSGRQASAGRSWDGFGGKRSCRRPPPDVLLLLAFGLVLPAPYQVVAGQTQWDLLFYGSSFSYLESQVKSSGYTGGFYGTFGARWKHLVEAGVARTRIEYRSGYVLEQHDLAGAYSHFWPRGSARAGAHLILNNDPTSTNGGVVVFGGASAYRVGVWSAGVEAAFSAYPDYGAGLNVVQVAPSVGFTTRLSPGETYLSGLARGYSISLSDDVGLGSRSFLSGEGSISLSSGPWTVSGFGWGGEQAFAVRQGGFLVFNVAERHTGGFGGGIRWLLSPKAAASAGLYLERFEDLGPGSNAWTRTLAVSFGLTL